MATVKYKLGSDVVELTDTPENREEADRRGATPLQDFTNGKETVTLPATKENFEGAQKRGFTTTEVSEHLKQRNVDPKTKMQSAGRGLAQGATFGFADEVSGAAGAGMELLKGNTDVGKNYDDYRDYARGQDKQAKDDNPWSYGAGEVGGGVLSGVATGGLGNGIKGGAAFGAAQGLGNGEGDFADQAGSVLAGGALGAAGGAVAKGVGALWNKGVGNTINEGKQYVSALGRGMKNGSREAAESGSKLPVVSQIENTYGAAKGALQEIKEQVSSASEFKDLAKQAIKVLHPGETGSVGNMSNDEAILGALMKDGDNPIKQFYATKSATLNPGAGSVDDYSGLLKMSGEDRAAARAFNARDAAKELVPDVEEAQSLFTKARGDRYNELQNQAKQTFEPASVGGVLDELAGAAKDAQHPIINGKARTAIEGARTMIEEGKGLRAHGLNEGSLADVPHEEIFQRLQKAREVIDSNVKWSSAQGDTESERLLKGVRDKIDAALKTSPEKVEADGIYSAGKRVEDNFFNATEFRKNGQVDIDEGKIARLLGGTDQAKRFQAALQQAKDYANTPGLSDEFRQQMSALVTKMEQKIGVADNQRAINAFRYKAGPSSPAIERMQSAAGKNDLLKDAVNAPAGFLNSMDEFKKFVAQKAGTSYSQMSPEQQLGVTKYWTWLKANQGATEASANKAWTKFVGSTPNPKDF